MSIDPRTAIIKNELHRLVVETDDIQVLNQIKSVFEILIEGGEEDWWDNLSEKEKSLIQKSLQQLDQGQRLTHQSVRQDINQLLGKE